MDIRTRRALAAVAETDARQLYLCPTCEGLLLTAASGLPLPMVRDEDGELVDGEVWLDATVDRICRTVTTDDTGGILGWRFRPFAAASPLPISAVRRPQG